MTRRLTLLLPAALLACDGGPEGARAPTFATDVAPILYEHCAPCHRPGEPAPFPLLAYEDARRKHQQIAKVTSRRLMPPWLPAAGGEPLAGARRLSAEQIETLARWSAAGAPRGDPAAQPAPPHWPEGWQLREPDLVVALAPAVEVPADGPELFRNFVIPVPLARARWVAAVEIRPESPAVHHAILQVDELRASRRLDAADPAAGFGGMTMGHSEAPGGYFLGWTPGKGPSVMPPRMAWRLQPASDLVLQLHLTPTGKPEKVRPRIGLYFTDEAPAHRPFPIVLYSEEIDIPAGEAHHVVRDRFRLPVPVRLFAVYPHAHYLCTTMHGFAVLPDGEERTLLRIDGWDFDWQDDYRFAQPVALPAGTELVLEFVYDNSAANESNPHAPPRRVRFGQGTSDEMATLTFTAVPEDDAGHLALRAATLESAVRRKPWDHDAHVRLARLRRAQGDAGAALDSLETALRLRPGDAEALAEQGACLVDRGDLPAAERALHEALRVDPTSPQALLELGRCRLAQNDAAGARAPLEKLLAALPDHVDARVLAGTACARAGDAETAIAHLRRAAQARPEFAEIHNNLATALFQAGKLADAAASYRAALELRPDYFHARLNLGRVLLALGQREAGATELRAAAALRPDDPVVRAALQQVGQ